VHIEHGFEALRAAYERLLNDALEYRALTLLTFAIALGIGAVGFFSLGHDFFPVIDAGRIRLHLNAAAGTRIEETEHLIGRADAIVRRVIPANERTRILDIIGLPAPYTMAVTDTTSVATSEGEVFIDLTHERTHTTGQYQRLIREALRDEMPELAVHFESGDMMTQITNFGISAPVDVQVTSVDRARSLATARAIRDDLRTVPGLVDVRLQQIVDAPRLHMDVDRTRLAEAGLTQRDLASSALLALGSSGTVSPNFWTDPATGNAFPVIVRVPDFRVQSPDDIRRIGLDGGRGTRLLGDLASFSRRISPLVGTQVDVQPAFNVRAGVEGVDLGRVVPRIDEILAHRREGLPANVQITLRGQPESMARAFSDLTWGLLIAAIAVYALMVLNFRSWIDPLIVLVAIVGASSGIVLSLTLTGTTLSIPSLMGAIMSIGIATSNSTLMVTFANEIRMTTAGDARSAALAAGATRLRPILMTSLAMLLGMLPMSLGLGEGGEMNAALARSVLGGLFGSTITTLFVVPVVYTFIRAKAPDRSVDPDLEDHVPVHAHPKEAS